AGTAAAASAATTNAPLESSPALDANLQEGAAYTGSSTGAAVTPTYDQDTYNYDLDRDLYKMDQHDDRIRLYEERLIANKRRMKTGEVTVGKHVETETARVSVPIEKERVVVERVASTDTAAVPVGEDAFHEGEVARMEVYEETPDVRKEAFVREEVRVKKVVDQDVVNSEEQIRREELDLDTQGRPIVDDSATRRADDSTRRV
ncbi:MAG: photosystem reaction center subunit H, partial [Leptolyngbya sp. ERB_1_2]